MTDESRNEYRAKCIEAMIGAAKKRTQGYGTFLGKYLVADVRVADVFVAAFDSLHGLARVCPVEATEEMIEAAKHRGADIDEAHSTYKGTYRAMSTAGDLTNGPEK